MPNNEIYYAKLKVNGITVDIRLDINPMVPKTDKIVAYTAFSKYCKILYSTYDEQKELLAKNGVTKFELVEYKCIFGEPNDKKVNIEFTI